MRIKELEASNMGGLDTPSSKVPAYPFKSPSPMITPDQSWHLAWRTLEHGSRATLGVVAPSVSVIVQQPNDREDLSIGERCNMTAAVETCRRAGVAIFGAYCKRRAA